MPIVSEPFGTDFPATSATPGRIDPGATVTGTVGTPADVDWFGTSLTGGVFYLISQQGSWDGALVYPMIRGAYDSLNTLLPNQQLNRDPGTRLHEMVFQAPASGNYFLGVGGNGNPTVQGNYALSLTPLQTRQGTAGNDWMVWQHGTQAMTGGAGHDMASFVNHDSAIYITLTSTSTSLSRFSGGDSFAWLSGFESVTGTRFGDSIASNVSGRLRGMDGNDTFSAEAEWDSTQAITVYDGGSGVDTVNYRPSTALGSQQSVSASLLRGVGWAGAAAGDTYIGIENLEGTFFNDTLTGDHGANYLFGNTGNDVLMGNGGNDTLDGDHGYDVAIYSYDSSQYTVTLRGFETIVAHTGGTQAEGTDLLRYVETIRFTNGDFTRVMPNLSRSQQLQGGAGDDTLIGGGRDDSLTGGSGDDMLYGGDGVDTAMFGGYALADAQFVYAQDGRLVVVLPDGTDLLASDIELLAFSDQTATQAEIVAGLGGSGATVVQGTSGPDNLPAHDGPAYYLGLAGNDTIAPGTGDDMIFGGDGIDTIIFSGAPGAVTVDLATGIAVIGSETDRIYGVENVAGSAHADTLRGDDGANLLQGIDGNDWLMATAGADTLDGGAGTDTVSYLRFGTQSQEAGFSITANLLTGTGGRSGEHMLISIENLTGSSSGDSLTGNHVANVLRGMGGHDTITGSGGNDTIDGGDGHDIAVFGHARSEYQITTTGTGTVVSYLGGSGADGTDRLTSIEVLRFADGDLLL